MNTSRMILSVLRSRTTRDAAIRARDLANLVGVSEREAREVVRALRILGYPIASTTEPPGGYWMAQRPEDLNETLRHLASRRRQIEEPMDALVLAQRELGKQRGA